ncbi:unnamed protein product [Prorocentrum cordatum]|uniref:Uncharacterized protein n=1 Tax=Prorocentrum cordatum TaxID=2364126 RepID=A0ABN9TQJ2_9DINO|nr:unnamed protein product [Polarella glacialis]
MQCLFTVFLHGRALEITRSYRSQRKRFFSSAAEVDYCSLHPPSFASSEGLDQQEKTDQDCCISCEATLCAAPTRMPHLEDGLPHLPARGAPLGGSQEGSQAIAQAQHGTNLMGMHG